MDCLGLQSRSSDFYKKKTCTVAEESVVHGKTALTLTFIGGDSTLKMSTN